MSGIETAPDTRPIIFEYIDDLYVGFESDYPDVYRFTFRDIEWLTDRYWILRKDVITHPLMVPVQDMPEDVVERLTFLSAVLDNELTPAGSVFAPTFAGELTRAGVTAFNCGYQSAPGKRAPSVLVRDGERIGCLMPMREAAATNATSIPAPAAVMEMFDRINLTGIVARHEAWCLAVALTGGAS